METAFKKNFADLDTFAEDADLMWSGNDGKSDKLKEKGQVGFINPDFIDFEALLYTMEDMTFEEM
jgi:hypothetical protein